MTDTASWIIAFLLVYLLAIGFLLYTIMFGGGSRHRDTCVGRCHDFLTDSLGDKLEAAFARVCCPFATDPRARASYFLGRVGYYFEKYAMVGIYLGLLAVGLTAAKRVIVPRLPELEVLPESGGNCPKSKLICLDSHGLLTIPPRANKDTVYFYAIVCFTSWLAVYLTNPGIITAENYETMKKVYEFDEVMFVSDKECTTCKWTKLPRSKHDNLLNACIMRYDHFCGWTGTAIGMFNTNRFLFFLMCHLAMMVHGLLLCAEIVYARMRVFIEGKYIYTPWKQEIKRFSPVVAFAAEPTVCLFFFMLFVSTLVVGGFLTYHCYLIYMNTTTSETAKWSRIHQACEEYFAEHGVQYGAHLRQKAEEDAKTSGQPVSYVPPFAGNGLPINIYNRGLAANALEVLFPSIFVQGRLEGEDERIRNKAD